MKWTVETCWPIFSDQMIFWSWNEIFPSVLVEMILFLLFFSQAISMTLIHSQFTPSKLRSKRLLQKYKYIFKKVIKKIKEKIALGDLLLHIIYMSNIIFNGINASCNSIKKQILHLSLKQPMCVCMFVYYVRWQVIIV